MQPSDFPINSVWTNHDGSIIAILKEVRWLDIKLSIYHVKDNTYQDRIYVSHDILNDWIRIN